MNTSIAIAVIAFGWTAPPEDYKGRPLSEWVADLSTMDGEKLKAAQEAFAALGSKAKDAVPALMKLLDSKAAGVSLQATIALGSIGPDAKAVVPVLADGTRLTKAGPWDLDAEALAAEKIVGVTKDVMRIRLFTTSIKGGEQLLPSSTYMREHTSVVVGHLIELCDSKEVEAVRLLALTIISSLNQPHTNDPKITLMQKAGPRVDSAVRDGLLKLLEDPSLEVRKGAAFAISRVAPREVSKTIPTVLVLLRTPNQTVAFGIAEILRTIPNEAFEAISPLFGDKDPRTRSAAASVLAQLKLRVPCETILATHTNPRNRESAATALGMMYGAALEAAPVLRNALKDDVFEVRFAAARSLIFVTKLTGMETVALPILFEGLEKPDAFTQYQAAESLSGFGADAKPAMPRLKQLVVETTGNLRMRIGLTMVKIDPKDSALAVPAITEALKNSSWRLTAVSALAAIGSPAQSAVPELLAMYDAKPRRLQIFAAEAVARIDPTKTKDALAKILKIVAEEKESSSMQFRTLAEVLLRVGPAAKSVVPELCESLKVDGSYNSGIALAVCLVGPEAGKPAFDWMRAKFGKENDNDLEDLMYEIRALGAHSKPLVPFFIAELKSTNPMSRAHAAQILGSLDAKEALPALKELAKSESRSAIQKVIENAVVQIEMKLPK